MDADQHIAAARQRLIHLAGLAAKTEASERRILSAAEHRREEVRGELERLRPRAVADRAAGDRYQELTAELGQLEAVIARAHQALEPGRA